MAEITFEKIVELYYGERPELVWIMGKDVYDQIKKLKDAQGNHIYEANQTTGTLLGVKIDVREHLSDTLELAILIPGKKLGIFQRMPLRIINQYERKMLK